MVPSNQLLVFDVRQGWDPLCQFLNVPVPDEPFPNINDAAEIGVIFNTIRVFTWVTLLGLTTLLVVCFYYNWLYTLLGLVLLVPLLLLSGKLITYLVSRQTSKSKEHDTHVFKSLYE